MLKGIIFDKDGVLVDFEKTWGQVLGDMAERLGGADAGLVRQLEDVAGLDRTNGGFASGSVWAAGNAEDLLDVWLPLLAGFSRSELEAYLFEVCDNATPHSIVSVKAMKTMFSALRKSGVLLGVATNDSEVSAKRTMAHFGLLDVFSLILGYNSVKNPKPSGDPVLTFCRHCAVEPGEVAVVGDNAHDMEMAMAAGAGVRIGVLSGNSTFDELSPLADFVVDDITHLPQALQERNLLTLVPVEFHK